eukprot:9290879-Alexandrium_andersonii.AAC.1
MLWLSGASVRVSLQRQAQAKAKAPRLARPGQGSVPPGQAWPGQGSLATGWPVWPRRGGPCRRGGWGVCVDWGSGEGRV